MGELDGMNLPRKVMQSLKSSGSEGVELHAVLNLPKGYLIDFTLYSENKGRRRAAFVRHKDHHKEWDFPTEGVS